MNNVYGTEKDTSCQSFSTKQFIDCTQEKWSYCIAGYTFVPIYYTTAMIIIRNSAY